MGRFRDDFIGTTSPLVRGFFLPSSDPDLVDWVVADVSSAPPDIVDGLARYGVQVRLMPGAGHFAMLDDPAGFNRILAGLVGMLRSGHR